MPCGDVLRIVRLKCAYGPGCCPDLKSTAPACPALPACLPCLPALPPLPGVQVSQMVSREFEKECVVVFDEAHNIDNVCIEALSGG